MHLSLFDDSIPAMPRISFITAENCLNEARQRVVQQTLGTRGGQVCFI